MSQILVVGASGTVGAELVKVLSAKGQRPVRVTSQQTPASDQVHLDLATGAGIDRALRGVESVFLLSPPGYTNQDALLNPVIDKAKAAGVKKIILMSAMGVNANDEAPLRKVELHLQKSGLKYGIIRPNWFMQNFNSYWIEGILRQGKILLPTGNAKGSFIDARDIASVAAELLLTDRFENQEFDLTGDRALNHDEVAQILTRTTGKSIVYEEITPGVMHERLLKAGLPQPYASFMLLILDFFKQGYAERTTDAVEKITGRKPISFERYAQDFRQHWQT